MKSCRIPQALVVAAVLALSSSGAFAASELNDAEMAGVYGQGLSVNTLGVLSAQAQSGSSVSAAGAADALASLSTLGGATQALENQLAQQQRLQAVATGVQSSLQITQTMLTADQAVMPIAVAAVLPLMALPIMGMSASSLTALETIIQNSKH